MDTDITKKGHLSYRDLGTAINSVQKKKPTVEDYGFISARNAKLPGWVYNVEGPERSPLLQRSLDNPYAKFDYIGNSIFDPKENITSDMLNNIGDIRAENQPWYAKVAAGIGKGAVTLATTFVDALGIPFGLIQGVSNAVRGGGATGFFQGLWDNPLINALTGINEWAEDIMPNYYTQDEQENPWGHIFSANFFGDKLIKNVGFMIGAYLGGIPYAKIGGALGVNKVKKASSLLEAEKQGMNKRAVDVFKKVKEEGFTGDALRTETKKRLAAEGLSSAERKAFVSKANDRLAELAKTTKANSQIMGVTLSALNEGIVEASQNSRDWANNKKIDAYDKYQSFVKDIRDKYGNSEEAEFLIRGLNDRFNAEMEDIEMGRAMMGNADMLLNLPILLGTNGFQLAHLYSRGFTSTMRKMGPFKGTLKEANLASQKTSKKATINALLKNSTEGLEEYLQRAASDGSGAAMSEIIDYHNASNDKKGKDISWNFISSMGKAIMKSGEEALKNIGNPQYLEEFFIGALSAAIGMPTAGSHARNVWVGKEGKFGLSGGFFGERKSYMEDKRREDEVAEYLNKRVKDPKFKSFYDALIKNNNLDINIAKAAIDEDKKAVKDQEFLKLFTDINAAASAGVLEEFLGMVDYNKNYTQEELVSIVKQTTDILESKEEKKEKDEKLRDKLQEDIKKLEEKKPADLKEKGKIDNDIKSKKEQLDEVEKRLSDEDNYYNTYDGPFASMIGKSLTDMTLTDESRAEMTKILDRNRKHVIDSINNYIKIRNNIDIETGGRLNDTQISTLTLLRAKIDDIEERTGEMAWEIYNSLKDFPATLKEKRDKLASEIEKASPKTDKSKKELKEKKKELESLDRYIEVFEDLLSTKKMTRGEKKAFMKGYGNMASDEDIEETENMEDRPLNAVEMSNFVPSRAHAMALCIALTAYENKLSMEDKEKVYRDIFDIYQMAKEKLSYNRLLRYFIKDPALIEEMQKESKRLYDEKEEKDKIDELAHLFKENATSYKELNSVYVDAIQQYQEDIAGKALLKAEETADEKTKKLIHSYRQGINTYNNCLDILNAIDDDSTIKMHVAQDLQNSLDDSMETANDDNLSDAFIEDLKNTSAALKKTDNPLDTNKANIIDDILKALENALSSIKTNNNEEPVQNPSDETPQDEAKSIEAVRRFQKKENQKPEDNSPASYNNCKASIKKEILDSPDTVYTKIDNLSEKTRKLIDSYNSSLSEDEKDKAITDATVFTLYQDILDGTLAMGEKEIEALDKEESTKKDSTAMENWDKTRSEDMKRESRTHFKSTYPSLYRHGEQHKELFTVDEETPGKDVWDRVKEILDEECGSYEFVDKNFLGYIFREVILGRVLANRDRNLPVAYLKSTDDKLLEKDVIFIGLKWNKQYENVLEEYFKEDSINIKLKKCDDGNTYVIIGTLTYDKNAAQPIKDGFKDLVNAINTEVDAKAKAEKEKGDSRSPFVVSSYGSVISTVYTGMQEIENSEGISKYMDLLSLANQMLEYRDGKVVFTYGVSINNRMVNSNDNVTEPNSNSVVASPGGIWVYVPKPDGTLYPVRCVRKTVKSWLKEYRQFLEDAIEGKKSEHTGYFENIIDLIKVLTDIDRKHSLNEKIAAKMALCEYFTFTKPPIHIDSSGNVDVFNQPLTGKDTKEVVNNFFNIITSDSLKDRDKNVKFTVPSPTKVKGITGSMIVASGIMKARLQSLNNFDANFLVAAMDANGNPINVDTSEEKIEGSDNRERRKTERNYEIGGVKRTFLLTPDGFVEVVGNENIPVGAETLALLNFAEGCKSRTPESSLLATIINQIYKNTPNAKEVASFILNDLIKTDKTLSQIYIKRPDKNAGEVKTYIYESMTNADGRLYELTPEMEKSDDVSENIIKRLQEIIYKNINKNTAEVVKLQKQKKEDNPEATIEKEDEKKEDKKEKKQEEKKETKVKKEFEETLKSNETGKSVFGGKNINKLNSGKSGLHKLINDNKKKSWMAELYSCIQVSEMSPEEIHERLKEIVKIKNTEEKRKAIDTLKDDLMKCSKP